MLPSKVALYTKINTTFAFVKQFNSLTYRRYSAFPVNSVKVKLPISAELYLSISKSTFFGLG